MVLTLIFLICLIYLMSMIGAFYQGDPVIPEIMVALFRGNPLILFIMVKEFVVMHALEL